MTGTALKRQTSRTLISDELHARLAARIVEDHGHSPALADRILDQALAFLAACAANAERPLAPSELVDVGWHTFILHTREYAAFCERLAGRFIHHVPTGESDLAGHGDLARATLVRTVEAIERLGLVVDKDLWPLGAANCQKCTGCHNGCHDDPPPPPA
ncbi:glycine-rich domain-containing protein [Actinokineospora sp. G85]|uniref:glycine-rich domain-containing protein n=1 Tax=Actinokineospora sp. G85 TaxID=3406626 RepID=UPI003C760BC3